MLKSLAVGLGATLAVGAVAVLVFALWATGHIGGADEDEYTARNEQLLDTLPVPPGVSLADTFSREQYNRPDWPSGFGPPTGWTTTRSYYRSDRQSWATIRSFYLARLLPVWSLSALGTNDITFVRGHEELWIGRAGDQFAIRLDRDCERSCAGVPMPRATAMVVELQPVGTSEFSGVAIIEPRSDSSVVEIDLAPPANGVVTHLHEGRCSDNGVHTQPRSADDTWHGKSTLAVAPAAAQLAAGRYSIDAHEPGAPRRSVACGNILLPR